MRGCSVFFEAYTTVSQLAALPWEDAKILAEEVAWAIRCDPTQGLRLLLLVLCRAPLVHLALLYPETPPEDLALFLYNGVAEDISPWGHAQDVLRGEVKDAKEEALAIALLAQDQPQSLGIDPLERLYSQEILAKLSPKDRETLILAASYPTEALARHWGVSFDTANTRIRRARERLKKLTQP